jgi:hypothetical protein
LKEEEHEQKRHREQFEEWEKIQSDIRSLRKDLIDPTTTEVVRREIDNYIECLSRCKNELAIKLGFQ